MKTNKGFTLIELLVVIAIIGILSSVMLVAVNSARMKARNAERLSDMRQMQIALELYYAKYNQYPVADFCGNGGWDVSGPNTASTCVSTNDRNNSTFTTVLVNEGFLPDHFLDPVTNNANGNYKYYRYGAGNYGCDSARGAYYVLGVVDMEGSSGAHPTNPGWSCPTRNWTGEFEWVMGKFEN
jgi:prepilin-type N-terminal cleavage/methylation domain-containing protein